MDLGFSTNLVYPHISTAIPQDLQRREATVIVAFKLEKLRQWIDVLCRPQAGTAGIKFGLIMVYL